MRWLVPLVFIFSCAAVAQTPPSPSPEAELRLAFAQARTGSVTDATRQSLKNHTLLPWLDALVFKQNITNGSTQLALALIQTNRNLPSSEWLISQWRQELIRRGDWQGVADWQARFSDNSIGTHCALLLAVPTARRDAAWWQSAQTLWLTEAQLPGHCQAIGSALKEDGRMDDARTWQRVDLLLRESNTDALPETIAALSTEQAALANSYRAALNGAQIDLSSWPNNARSQTVMANSLVATAKRNPDDAEIRLNALPGSLVLPAELRERVLSEIALWSMVNYQPQAERRFFGVPEAVRSANLREWYMRWNFANNNDNKTLAAFSQLLPAQQSETRWLYFKARVLQRLNRDAQATPLYQQAAQSATFHGWLAADALQASYAFCPAQPMPNSEDRMLLAKHAGLQRAFMLWQLNQANTAIWEWNAAFKTLNAEQQRQAVAMAQQVGWYDRAVFSLEAGERNTRLYALRFATPYLSSFREAAARFNIDAAWLIAHARAESIFMPDVVSSANARGLLQVLPSTAEAIAARHSIAWQGADSLYRPEVNIPLGAGALQEVIGTYPGKAYQAIAAYNAGPTATQRWNAARDALEPAFWIETVPYKETREYVPRVLAFSVIYDWRLQQPVRRISQRLVGDWAASKPAELRCPQPSSPALTVPATTQRKGKGKIR